jgi:hypothetical protein
MSSDTSSEVFPISTAFDLRPRDPLEIEVNIGANLPNSILDQIIVVGNREGGMTECYVPADLIDYEEVPVKEDWAKSLAKQIADQAAEDGGTGQMTPITLGYIPGESTLKIIDGFHRDAALRLNKEQLRYATVVQTDWDKLYDKRIFMAKDHVHVRFSRVVQWIREAWEYSGLSDKVTVEQAVLLYRFESSGKNLKLGQEESEAAKAWVQRKQDMWQIAAMTMHSHLKIAERVDSELVHATREKKNGCALEAPTQSIIRIFSENIPDNSVLQNVVMDAAKDHNLKGPHVRALCNLVKDCTSKEEAKVLLAAIDFKTWKPEYAESKNRALRRAFDPRHKGAVVLSRVTEDVGRVRQRVENILPDEPVTGVMRLNLGEARAEAEIARRDLSKLIAQLTHLIGDKPELASTEKPAETVVAAPSSPAKPVSLYKYIERKIPEITPDAPPNMQESDPFNTLLRDFFKGETGTPGPILTDDDAAAAEDRIDWETRYGTSPVKADTLQTMVDRYYIRTQAL